MFDRLYVQLGFIQGDGCTGRLKSDTHRGMEVNIGYKDDDVLQLFGLKKVANERKYYVNGFNEICDSLGFSPEQLPNRPLPTKFDSWHDEYKISFLHGLYSANGCFIKSGRIAFKTTCKELSFQLKQTLEYFGFNPYITTNKSKRVEFENGVYTCKESYDVNLGRQSEILRFYNEIGFIQKYKMKNIKSYLESKFLL